MGVRQTVRLGIRRRRWYWRALRRRRDLRVVARRTDRIRRGDILLLCTLRNEAPRLAHFLDYYRALGVGHFLFVDNDSDDGSRDHLAAQPDCSVWSTQASYRRSRFGTDWMNWLGRRHCCGHWVLCVDADELLVYPFCDTRPLRALTDWLDASRIRSFGAMLLDLYPRKPGASATGQDPVAAAPWFDAGNYTISRNWDYHALWIQGGPRARAFFADRPYEAPALNKVPLVRWRRGTVFASSTHMLLPRGLNLVYDEAGGETTCGVLLHTKFLGGFSDRAAEEAVRAEHYRGGREYAAYAEGPAADLWCGWSERYANWRQLEGLGLLSRGNWA